MDVEPAAPAGKRSKTAVAAPGASSAAASSAPAAKTEAVAETFSMPLLRLYYQRLFPYEEMFDWLSYGSQNDTVTPVGAPGRDLMTRREISFTVGETYMRYLCFDDLDAMRAAIKAKQPHKIDIGAIYSSAPSRRHAVRDFKPLQRELVFDIDLDDYDDVRTGFGGTHLEQTRAGWVFFTAACKVLDAALREDFGFKDILWVFSGRRGVHCWVCDERARMLTDEGRTAVAEYLSVVNGNEKSADRTNITVPLHPSLQRAYDILEPIFVDGIAGDGTDFSVGGGQLLLGEDDATWDKILNLVPDSKGIRETLRNAWRKSGSSPQSRWEKLKAVCEKEAKSLQRKGAKDAAKKMLKVPFEIVFVGCYPRLDVNVSTHRNHLLKSPFCVHPKTGCVCVCFNPEDVSSFDPCGVPNLATVRSRGRGGGGGGGGGGGTHAHPLTLTPLYTAHTFSSPFSCKRRSTPTSQWPVRRRFQMWRRRRSAHTRVTSSAVSSNRSSTAFALRVALRRRRPRWRRGTGNYI